MRWVGIGDCGAGAVDVESSLSEWAGGSFIAGAGGGGDDDVGFAVHEAAGFVGADVAIGQRGGGGRGG